MVDVGGLGVRVSSPHAQWLQIAQQRYESFRASCEADVEVCYRVRETRSLSPAELFAGRMAGLACERHGKHLSLSGSGFSADLDLASRTLRVEGPLAVYPVDLLLPVLWYELHSGVILHSAALADRERGYLLCGPSGSGKSTMAGLFPDAALCDEFAAVSLAEDANRLSGLPFWKGRPGSADLQAIYLLEHGATNSRTAVRPTSAYRALQRETCWPLYDTSRLEQAFAELADLVARVPVWRLAFRPQREVWETLVGTAS